MYGDEYEPYIRLVNLKHPRNDVPHIYIVSGFYALRGANEDWNNGKVRLDLEMDVCETGQNTLAMIQELASKYPEIKVIPEENRYWQEIDALTMCRSGYIN
jgi:hypothetical protein